MQTTPPPIIVFSHLRWNFVTQRPQHIMTRLSKFHDVVFIEEPITPPADGHQNNLVSIKIVSPRITVVQPHRDFKSPSLNSFSWIKTVLPTLLKKNKYYHKSVTSSPILWFYSPAFVRAIDEFDACTVVYDCMDELSAFKGADPNLVNLEKQLLNQADLVFTGGKSLYEIKSQYHKRVFCYPSSVDQQHFKKATDKKTVIPNSLAKLPHPRVGFYGVLDERLDLSLMANVAYLLPMVQFVYIGPVVKIDPATLPQAANIHYLGQQPYEMLPAFLKGLDIAFMPFALNQATQFISPTKTLEFMAANKPIVSTPIYDIQRDYYHEVSLVDSATKAAGAIQAIQYESLTEKKHRHFLYQEIISRTSWDNTVKQMRDNLDEVINHNYEPSWVPEDHLGNQLQLELVIAKYTTE
jgi:UDP-galactopyranose mutase